MEVDNTNPGAVAGAHRADVTLLTGKTDTDIIAPGATELQVRKLMKHYAMSLPLAYAIAELAFRARRSA